LQDVDPGQLHSYEKLRQRLKVERQLLKTSEQAQAARLEQLGMTLSFAMSVHCLASGVKKNAPTNRYLLY